MRRLVLLPVLFALCFAAGGAAGYALYRPIRAALRPSPPRPTVAAVWEGRALPQVPQWTLEDAPWSGPEAGRTTVLAFWSAGCGSCLTELAALSAFAVEAGSRLSVIGIPMERDLDVAACVVASKGIRYPQLRGEPAAAVNPLAMTLGVRSVPSFWVVDGRGVVRAANLRRVADLRSRLATLATLSSP